jgi:hypothetical protein
MPYTGVPKYIRKDNIFVPEYPMVNRTINHATIRTFYYGLFKYTIIFGFLTAFLTTDREFCNDDLASRPDLKEMRIMIRDDYIPVREKKVFEIMSGTYFGKPLNEEGSHGLFKRITKKLYPYFEYNPSPQYYAPHFDFRKDYQSENWSNHYH